MQTFDTNDLVNDLATGRFESCSAFAAGPQAAPVCADCGWLDADHTPEIADVHALPARRRTPAVPARIAS